MLLVPATVVVFAAFSNIVKPSIVIKSPPIILKIASVKVPATKAADAVNSGFAPTPALANVIVFPTDPVAVIANPPIGATSE